MTGKICKHIARFYPGIAGNPAIFWKFSSTQLPAGHELQQQDSQSGDKCHHNIFNVSDKSAKDILKQVQENDFTGFNICDENNNCRQLNQNDIEELIKAQQ